jgi:FtsH-binding integral membrane protein
MAMLMLLGMGMAYSFLKMQRIPKYFLPQLFPKYLQILILTFFTVRDLNLLQSLKMMERKYQLAALQLYL